MNWQAVVLAAGRSSRFLWPAPKLLYPLVKQPIIGHIFKTLLQCSISPIFVLGHRYSEILLTLGQYSKDKAVAFVMQNNPLGTGHALLCSKYYWTEDNILVQNGDMPLVKPETIVKFCKEFQSSKAIVMFAVARVRNPFGFGRVIGKKIVEERDCTTEQKSINLINAGLYAFKREFLEKFCSSLDNKNNSGEFYLTDLPALALENNFKVVTFEIEEDEARGINTLDEAKIAEDILEKRIESLTINKSTGHC